ncbi:MAG: hypothetical protein WCP39_02635 [Chlamydiota bacterium]
MSNIVESLTSKHLGKTIYGVFSTSCVIAGSIANGKKGAIVMGIISGVGGILYLCAKSAMYSFGSRKVDSLPPLDPKTVDDEETEEQEVEEKTGCLSRFIEINTKVCAGIYNAMTVKRVSIGVGVLGGMTALLIPCCKYGAGRTIGSVGLATGGIFLGIQGLKIGYEHIVSFMKQRSVQYVGASAALVGGGIALVTNSLKWGVISSIFSTGVGFIVRYKMLGNVGPASVSHPAAPVLARLPSASVSPSVVPQAAPSSTSTPVVASASVPSAASQQRLVVREPLAPEDKETLDSLSPAVRQILSARKPRPSSLSSSSSTPSLSSAQPTSTSSATTTTTTSTSSASSAASPAAVESETPSSSSSSLFLPIGPKIKVFQNKSEKTQEENAAAGPKRKK